MRISDWSSDVCSSDLSLMQMAKTSAVLARLREEGIPFISVLTDPVYGGVSASLAMLGDVIVAEPKALIGFAGPRVIEQTAREKLPEGFRSEEHTSELQSLMRISYAVFCLKKKKTENNNKKIS